MKHVLKDTQIYFNEFNISGLLSNATLAAVADIQEDTGFGDDTRSRLAGLVDSSLNASGFYDSAEEKEIFDQVGSLTEGIVSVAPKNATEGDIAYAFEANVTSLSLFGDLGGVAPFSFNANGDSRLVRGVVAAVGAKTADGNSSTFDLGAVASGGKVFASLHVIDHAGTTPTLDVTIVSDDDGTFDSVSTTRITFTQVGDADAVEFKSADGPITDTNWRVQWDVQGVGASYTILVVLGIISDL